MQFSMVSIVDFYSMMAKDNNNKQPDILLR